MTLITQLNTLETSGLLRLAVAQPELEYMFRHALVQDATYQSLLKHDRRRLHAMAGEALKQLFPNQLAELAATLAYHYEKAEVPDQAAHYLRQAGDRARSSYANSEAIAFYRAAIKQIEKLSGSLSGDWREILRQLYEDVGDLLEQSGQHDGARDIYDRALALVTADETILQARLRRKLGYSLMIQGQHERALATFDETETILGSEPVASDSAWWQEWIQLQLERMFLHYVRNEVVELAALIERTQPAIDQFGIPEQRFGFYRGLSFAACRRERYLLSEQTLTYVKAGLTHAYSSHNLNLVAEALFLVGFCHAHRQEWAEAEENLLESVRLAERIGYFTMLARALTHLTNMYRRCGQIVKARESNLQLLEAAESGQLREYIAAAKANAGWLAWREGDLSEARRLGEVAFEMWQQSPMLYPFQWTTLWPLLALALAQDRLPDAIEYAQRLIAPVQLQLPVEVAQVLAEATREGDQKLSEKVREGLARAVELAQETGYL